MKDEITVIEGKRYRKLTSIWNENFDWNNPVIDVCDSEKWTMIDGIEYEELGEELNKKGGE